MATRYICNKTERKIWTRTGVGAAAHIVQHTRLLCPRLSSDGCGIVLVTAGRKIVRHRAREISINPGEVLLIPDGIDFDVINEPSAESPYQALALNFSSELVQRRHDVQGEVTVGTQIVRGLPEIFHEACARAFQAISAGDSLPDTVAGARVEEILLWLGLSGYRFAVGGTQGPVISLRRIIQSLPSHNWRVQDVARMMGMSEPTLRRRLVAAGTGFVEIVQDVRMTQALQLLQSTDMPVTHVALEVGYESASHFAARFRERFGFLPHEIRIRVPPS